MGYSAYAYTIYGVKTYVKNVKQNVKVRACHHSISKNMNFCPECGEPAYEEQEAVLLEPMEEKKLSYFYPDYSNQDEIIVGFVLGSTDYNHSMKSCKESTPEMLAEILKFFSDHNLPYSEKNVKTFTMISHSY